MERLKKMSLKKALFTIAFLNNAAALLLSALTFWGCMELSSAIAPQGIMLDVHSDPVVITKLPGPTPDQIKMAELVSVLQILLPMGIFTFALLFTASAFYRLKLKEPLETLSNGASRIIDGDLDFVVEARSRDELGQLCIAFETMRKALLENNRRLWRQAEERKRLNAAFSHNLRNPVTVLKGCAKLARQELLSGSMDTSQLSEHLGLMESYSSRIECYVETMSRVQKLEDIQPALAVTDYHDLTRELAKNIRLMGSEIGKELLFTAEPCSRSLLIDSSFLYQIVENLVSNALRFARSRIRISCSVREEMLVLSVRDDGCGFPAMVMKNGIRPFQKGEGEEAHFGMGLYTCMLLATRHGGTVTINPAPAFGPDLPGPDTPTGAQVLVTLKIT